MALDFYINNERFANSSMFYRVTSTSSYTFNIKLSDEQFPHADYSNLYVTYSYNNSPRQRWTPDPNGFLLTAINVDVKVPCICSVSVSVSSGELSSFIGDFVLSGIFVRSFPQINFIAYPSLYVDIQTGDYKTITSSNYLLSSRGQSFYGEGHTEIINLSCNNFGGSGNTMNWFVGNTIVDLVTATTHKSVLSVVAGVSTGTVTVTSEIGKYPTYPISLWATNSVITTAGPIITYTDGGIKQYYPFFTSSLSANGSTENSNKEKTNIRVLPYPERNDVVIIKSPFKDTHFYLPFDYVNQSFVAESSVKNILGDALDETFSGTKWVIQGTSPLGDSIPDWYVPTPFLSSVFAYKFKLSYDKNTANTQLENFKASAIQPTSIVLNLSSYRECVMNLPAQAGQVARPTDWQRKTVTTTNSISAVVNIIPFDKIYTPNYFNVKGQDVPFSIATQPDLPWKINQLTIQSDKSPDTLVLNKIRTAGTMKFDVLGVVDLSATAILENIKTKTKVSASLIYQDMVEILSNYDCLPEEDYFHTLDTPLILTYDTQPRLSPNEWATADNVNSIIEKVYTTAEELLFRSRVYTPKTLLYGHLGPAEKTSIIQPVQTEWITPPHLWVDLDCSTGDVTDETASWLAYESVFPNVSATWEWQDCGKRITIDPSCFEKFCVQWSWKWRAKGASSVDVTWADTKAKNKFAKKWRWETCSVDAVNINCDRTRWNISTVDFDAFPFADANYTNRCSIVDADVNSQTDQIVLAHRTELHLINKDYHCTHTARTAMADELFSFQNIVGISTTAQGKVAVLDGTIPRVSIYTIDNNDFVLFSTWSSYGLKETPQGLQDPLDIHVDKYDTIWIADTGNKCIKKFTLIGKPLLTISHAAFDEDPPLSLTVDSQNNIHCLTSQKVIVFDRSGNFSFEYSFSDYIDGPVSKINVSFNKEIIYITYQYGVIKYFRNGTFFGYLLADLICKDGSYFEGYNSITQDKFRNIYITAGDKILQVADVQQIITLKAEIPSDLYWSKEDLMVHKEEYIQPWVYLKSFHRLWDNIELLRNSIIYATDTKCQFFTHPVYQKEELIIGQNEIVTNAVINRLSEQIWANLQNLIKYFNSNC